MKKYIATALYIATLLFTTGCSEQQKAKSSGEQQTFTDEVRLSYTPVKNLGKSSLCWAYAMLATIETEHIMRGDSVNLSPAYVARMFMNEQVDACYLNRGKTHITTRGTMPQLIRLIQTYGLMPYDSYNTDANINVTARKMQNMIRVAAAKRNGINYVRKSANNILDNGINPLPLHVYMYSMEYTPLEFAHSVCMPDEYQAITSFTHMPMNKKVVLEVPDNFNRERFINIPLDHMMNIMERSIRSGHPVCWEGDISERGFSLEDGIADIREDKRAASQQIRQKDFEALRTTDDHCMAIVGIAHDSKGRKFFICKNSWGTANKYRGFIYMSFDYARMKTVAIMVNSIALS